MYYNIPIHLSKALHLQIIFIYVISCNFSHFAEKEQSWEAMELSPGSSSVASQALYDARVDTGLIPHWRLSVLFVIITRLNSVVRHTCFSDSWWQRVNLSKINWPKWCFLRQNLLHAMSFVHKGPVFNLIINLSAF